MAVVQSVRYTDGNGDEHFALVLKTGEDKSRNLYVIPDSGEPYVRNGVNQGDGPDTWHD